MTSTPERGNSERIWTPANIITLFRICLVPVFVIIFISPWPEWLGISGIVNNQVKAWISAAVFIIISCTDWIDGYLARSRNEVTDLGKFLDPLADKILVVAALIALVELQVLPSWPALIILAREFIVSGVRMIAASKGTVIAASWYGKVKTVLQIIAIVMFIIKGDTDFTEPSYVAFYVCAWLIMIAALVMTIISMLDYIAKARHLFTLNSANGPDTDDINSDENIVNAQDVNNTASRIVKLARTKGVQIGLAESITGGMVASAITSVANSSEIFKGGFVTYTDEVKHSSLAVNLNTLKTHGAVSAEVALEMVQGVYSNLSSDISVSLTGYAGPASGSETRPVGTVYMGIYCRGKATVKEFHFDGDRNYVRLQTTYAALCAIEDELQEFC